MANIPIRDIPGAVVASPDPSNLIPMDNGSLMQKTTIENAVNTTLPLSSQAEAEAGVDNAKRMSPLRTKQAIDAQTPSIVNTAITALNLGTMSQEDTSDYTPTSGLAAVALSNDYDDLDNLPTLGTAAATDASDYATAAQGIPPGGLTAQSLIKSSDSDYAVEWATSAAATAVSYAPQTLSPSEQAQARANIGFDYFYGKAIGEPFPLWDHMTGVPTPPKGQFIKLTAGLTGPGGYNEDALATESVTGSFPLITATAKISDVASPIYDETVQLINTESRFLRPAPLSGTTEDFALQGHYHRSFEGPASTNGNSGGNGVYPATRVGDANTRWNAAAVENNNVVRGVTNDATYGTALVATETRPRNISATYYMRIK